MPDYLIEQYNADLRAVQDSEAKALAKALEIYTEAVRSIVENAALDRVEAAATLAAAMSQRDHAYHNGPPASEETSTPERPAGAETEPPGEAAAKRQDTEEV